MHIYTQEEMNKTLRAIQKLLDENGIPTCDFPPYIPISIEVDLYGQVKVKKEVIDAGTYFSEFEKTPS